MRKFQSEALPNCRCSFGGTTSLNRSGSPWLYALVSQTMGGKIEKDSFGYCHRDIGPFVLDFRQCGYQKGRRGHRCWRWHAPAQKKLFIRSGCALFAEPAPRCPGLADLTYQGAASVGGLMSMAGDRGPVPDHRNHGDGAQPVNIFAIIAPHNRYAALVRPHLWHVLRRARITSSVRPS
jgi:hypothetical protein